MKYLAVIISGYMCILRREQIMATAAVRVDFCGKGHCASWGSGVCGEGREIGNLEYVQDQGLQGQDCRRCDYARTVGGRTGFWGRGRMGTLSHPPWHSPTAHTTLGTCIGSSAHTKRGSANNPLQSGLLLRPLTEHETHSAGIHASLLPNDNSQHPHAPLPRLQLIFHVLFHFAQDCRTVGVPRTLNLYSELTRCRIYSGVLDTGLDSKGIMTLSVTGRTLMCAFDS